MNKAGTQRIETPRPILENYSKDFLRLKQHLKER